MLAAATLRPRFVATVDIDGWRIKTYWVCPDGGRPRPDLLAVARKQAAATLPDRPDRVGAFGVGFLVVHATAGHLLTLVDWWMQPDELYQRAFATPPDRPRDLEPLATAAIGGVTELAICAHESQAWLRHVVANPAGRDIEGYLADVLTAPALTAS